MERSDETAVKSPPELREQLQLTKESEIILEVIKAELEWLEYK